LLFRSFDGSVKPIHREWPDISDSLSGSDQLGGDLTEDRTRGVAVRPNRIKKITTARLFTQNGRTVNHHPMVSQLRIICSMPIPDMTRCATQRLPSMLSRNITARPLSDS
jgi:hypothetical protein